MQLEFATSLLHPDAERRLLAALVGDEANNRDRVARYRARLWSTWHRVLACAYPVVRSLMGDDFFLTLSREYGIADPVRSGDLNGFGSRMAELLEAWPPTATCRHLADVARLEWLVHRACFAADATTRLPDPWAQCTRDTLAHCWFGFTRPCSCFTRRRVLRIAGSRSMRPARSSIRTTSIDRSG
ncbi:HvfC/BufC N-terminal domain-containing protein [Burkholderia multivorans]|uniref:HvfC/BufC N-terminal domain-containing protein n=1 Tax=Burkholderia multivorans TaxID=87883 RepID=UPI00345E2ADE